MNVNRIGRRTGDQIEIPGDYQYRATYQRSAPQRFWHQRRFRTSLEMLSPQPGMRILDVGCGSGVFAAKVAACPGTEVLAVDGNPAAIDFARRQFEASNLQFVTGHVDDLRFPEASFDRISLLEVIEHVYAHQASAILRNLHNLLKPGGRVVVSTPNARSCWPVLEWLLDRLHLVAHMEGDQHVAKYHPLSLRSLGESVGFRLVESRTLFIVSPLVSVVSSGLADRLATIEQKSLAGNLLIQSFERPLG